MVQLVTNKKELKQFIYFVKELYQGNEHYVLPFFQIQIKELTQLVLNDKTYKAIMMKYDNHIISRVLYTFKYDSNGDKICYFSFFDAYDDPTAVKEMFEHVEEDCRSNDVLRIEGTYSPYDPDTRRGILVDGFDISPTLFTSYNYPYYQSLIEMVGFGKKVDTFSLKANVDELTKKKLTTISNYVDKKLDVKIDHLRLSHLKQDISDVHEILLHATTEQNYQEAPSIDMIERVANNLKLMIDPKLILIAREKSTNNPVGFCLVMPDYNQLFKKMNGRLQLFRILFQKHKISKGRGMLQYVIPEYQSTGVIGALFHRIILRFEERGMTQFEAGTMLEENLKPLTVFDKFGGKIVKTYRIYRKEL